MKVIIPENIADVTLSQYQKYHKLNKRENITDLEYNKRAISIFTNLPYQTIGKIKQTDYKMLIEGIVKALETPVEFTPTFILKDVEYGFVTNFDDITQGEFIDLTEYQNDVQDYHKLMAVIFREITNKDKLGNYKIKSYTGTKDRSEVFKDMPMNIVNGALGFFLNLSKELKNHIQKSTIAELAKV